MFTQYDDDGNLQTVQEPAADYGYTYADYLKWKFEERVELFKGRLMKMSAPNRVHQTISMNLSNALYNFLKSKTCQVFHAPFDVRIPRPGKTADEEIMTVVQPDLCVICDETKLDSRGCIGAPDIAIEILSPGNSKKELKNKFDIYEEAGVKEYWMLNPEDKSVFVYVLQNGLYIGKRPLIEGQAITTDLLQGLQIEVADIFN